MEFFLSPRTSQFLAKTADSVIFVSLLAKFILKIVSILTEFTFLDLVCLSTTKNEK